MAQLKINYENESMNLINDVEAMIENMKEYAVNRDLFAKLNDSIKVKKDVPLIDQSSPPSFN